MCDCTVTTFLLIPLLQDMSPPALISRSLSLPSCQEDIRRPSLTYPTRQPSQMVCLDTPLTPPMSPKLNKDIRIEDQHDQTEPESSQLQVQEIPQDAPQLMEVDTDDVVPLHRPQRLLEDEKVHLQRSGIKLSDFEVRGTLGMQSLLNLFTLLAYSFLQGQGPSGRCSSFAIGTQLHNQLRTHRAISR